MKNRRPPEVCPVCDEDVPSNAKACPKCGACYESGWRDAEEEPDHPEIDYGVLDLPDDSYESDEERKEARRQQRQRGGLRLMWRWVALLVLIALFWGFWKWLGWQWRIWGGPG